MAKRPMYLQHVNVYVRNVERSKKWYEDLLGLHVYEYRPGWAAFLTADKEQSHEGGADAVGRRCAPAVEASGGPKSHSLAPRNCSDDLKEFYDKIKAEGEPISPTSPTTAFRSASISRDPDGNGVEVFYGAAACRVAGRLQRIHAWRRPGAGTLHAPWDAEIGRDGPPARQAAAE